MTGSAQWGVFDASAKPSRGLVPSSLRGLALNANPAYATSTWPELAFPAGTTFSGLALQSWGWTYHVPALTVTTIKVIHGKNVADKGVPGAELGRHLVQPGGGQLAHDGQVKGR